MAYKLFFILGMAILEVESKFINHMYSWFRLSLKL